MMTDVPKNQADAAADAGERRGWVTWLYDRPLLLLVLTAWFWAGNAIASRLAVGEVAPFTLTCLRWFMVIAVLWPLYGREVRAHWPQIRPRLGRIVAMAGLGFTGFNALFYVAAYDTTAVNIGILQGSIPVFVIVLGYLAYRSRVTLAQLAGVLITLVGVVTIATAGSPQRLLEIGLNRGDLAMIAACFLYAFYTVALRERPAIPGTAFFTLMAVIAAVTSLPLLAFEVASGRAYWPTVPGWLITLFVAVFPSCLSQLFFMRGVDLVGPARAGVFVNLVPVFAAILAVALLGEPFAWHHAVSLALVLGGIALAQRSKAAVAAG